MPSRPVNSRLDDLMSWFAASVLVTAGVIYTLKLRDGPHEPAPAAVPPRATPAQEPLTLQELRAVERGRGRRARKPLQLPWRRIGQDAPYGHPHTIAMDMPLPIDMREAPSLGRFSVWYRKPPRV